MRLYLIWFFVIIGFLSSLETYAQKSFQKDCNENEMILLKAGETFINNCDSTFVLKKITAARLLGVVMKQDSLTSSLEKQNGILKDIIDKQNNISEKYQKILAIQDSSYNSLRGLQGGTSGLVQQSLKNTENALTYAKKLKLTSYLTSGVIGFTAGGLIDNKSKPFGLGGAFLGLALGAALNYLIQEIL